MEKNECYRCGVSGEQSKLFDAVSREGVVKICEDCSVKDDVPVIKKPTEFQLKEAQRPPTVFERLSKAAGLDPDEVKSRRTEEARGREVRNQNVSLRKIVDENFKAKVMNHPANSVQVDLVDNFHWVVMRARRGKHLTQKELADSISVPESAIRLLEQKILPEDNYQLVNKIEQFLRIKIRKGEDISQKQIDWEGDFSKDKIQGLTIADLKKVGEKNNSSNSPIEKKEENKKGWFSGFFSKKNKDASEENNEPKPEIKVEIEEIELENKESKK